MRHTAESCDERTAWTSPPLYRSKVGVVLGVASGTVDESELAQWLRDHARAV
jgi:hypothetical protein